MKIFIGIALFVFLTSSLSAYPRCVILASFKHKIDAQKKFNNYKEKYSELIQFSKDNDFEINLRKSGEYFIITAEVFYDKESLDRAMKAIRVDFKSSFISNYTAPKKTKPLTKEKVIVKKQAYAITPEREITNSVIKSKKDIARNNREMNDLKQNTKGCSWIFGCD